MRARHHATVAAALALALAGCGGDGSRSATYGGVDGGCTEEQRPAEQSGGHLLGDATPAQPYNSVPPTSGWHSAGAPRYGIHHDDPLSEAEQVTVLELGGIVLAYHQLDDADRAELDRFAKEHHRVVAVTPYEKLEAGDVAMTAWGVLRHCDGVEADTIQAFIQAHRGGGPEH